MKVVIYVDEEGYKRQVLLRDQDNDPRLGIPQEPPDINALDWEAIKRDLHNQLVDRKLMSWADVQKAQNGISASITAALKRELINLYRVDPMEENHDK